MRRIFNDTEPRLHRLMLSALFALIFLFTPIMTERVASGWFYWRVVGSVTIDRPWYYQCDSPVIEFERYASLDLHGFLVNELIRIDGHTNHNHVVWQDIAENVYAGRGTEPVEALQQIPCNMPEGEYKIRRSFIYDVNGNVKTSTYTTPSFYVSKIIEPSLRIEGR